MSSTFLNGKIGDLPFKYSGDLVAVNSQKASIWKPMLDVRLSKLDSWHNTYVSHLVLGGE